MYRKVIKPFLDALVALIVFIILLPIFITVLIILAISNGGSPFFTQLRPGLHSKIFKIIKFKTMNDKKDASGKLLADEIRLTSLGKFIRKTSLDELPQLLNVIKGDMSLVGPRPLLPEYLHLYTPEQARRHDVKPGITGWAQVNGRNAISWDEKFKLDVWYVEKQSLLLDLRILFKTVKKVVISEGISSNTTVTMERFEGLNKN